MIKKIKAIPKFFKEIREELKKVNWSTRQELTSATLIVIIVAAMLTLYIFFIDKGLSSLVREFLKS
ncbi:MAG: preprotein translocase subunit SecE [Candidatus Omnitrophica bacterium]|nr:preprotein translocase subunit SecE [Candidatus Omnitrophota bacterium]